MKPLILLLGLLVTSDCKTMDEPMKFRTISEGAYSAVPSRAAEAHLVVDAASYAQLWDRLIGRGTRPEIDFATEVAVFLLAGERPTGGYGIAPKGLAIEGETLVVDAEVTAPGPDMMVTQALTSPWEVIAVSRRDVRSVRWQR